MGIVENRSNGKPENIRSDGVLVDIIIPFYNTKIQYTRAALESVRAQTYTNWRAIVVNDGSSEESTKEIEALIRSYHDEKIRYLKTENGGPAAARNAGMKQCSGEWVAFLDSDDSWTADSLEVQVAEIARHPEIGMLACEGVEYSPDGELVRQRCLPRPFTRETVHAKLKRHCIFTPSGVMIRRDVFRHLGGFAEDIIGTEDYEMFTRIAACYEIGVLHLPLYKKITLPESLFSNPDVVVRYGPIAKRKARELLGRRRWPGSWLDDLTLRRTVAHSFLYAAWLYARRQEARKAAVTAIRGLAHWPFLPLRYYKSVVWHCTCLIRGRVRIN